MDYDAFFTQNVRLVFCIFEKPDFEKRFWTCHLFYFIFKGKKIRKKTLNVIHNKKSKSVNVTAQIRGHFFFLATGQVCRDREISVTTEFLYRTRNPLSCARLGLLCAPSLVCSLRKASSVVKQHGATLSRAP